MKRILTVAAMVVALGVAFFLGWVRLPYYAVGPGPARQVLPLIRVQGAPRYESSGTWIMTTVRFFPVTSLQALWAWLDPHQSLVRRDVLFPGGETRQQEQQRSLSQMDQSKIDAAYVVLNRLEGYPGNHDDGALIEAVVPGCPAEGELFAGDVVEAIDGVTVTSRVQASKTLDRIPADEPITFRIRAAGETHDIEVERGTCGGSDHPLVGIRMVNVFPIGVSISSGDVGGPSAGLMWALGLYDLLTPGDLTDGRTIAGTGTIDTRGHVGPIGGISDKVVAAERAGADLFLVPRDDMDRLREADTDDMKLIPVGTFDEALAALRSA
jgi:PDZ domain-containing protein